MDAGLFSSLCALLIAVSLGLQHALQAETFPARLHVLEPFRSFLACLPGAAVAGLMAASAGATWQQALAAGLTGCTGLLQGAIAAYWPKAAAAPSPPAPPASPPPGVLAALFAASSMLFGLGAAGALSACRLTPAQAQTAIRIEKPICDTLGGIAVLELPIVDGIVGVLCEAIAADITAAETVEPAPPDGGVLPTALRRPPLATPGCVPVPVPGDPFHQRACPELHAQVLAASQRAIAKASAAK